MISIKNEMLKPVLLTFSKKNLDVAAILHEISTDGTKKTDYICEAVRYYYNLKGSLQNQALLSDSAFEEKFQVLFYKYMDRYLSEHAIKSTSFDISEITEADLGDD